MAMSESPTAAVKAAILWPLGSISSSDDVMSVDPNSLPIARCPMSWFPDVIGAAYIIARPVAVIRPIAHLHSDGTWITRVIRSVIIRTATVATIIGSVARVGAGAVIASTSY